MKKTGIALVSVLLAGSLVAFTACGDGKGTDIGKVDGKFDTEATETELTTAIESIDPEKAFGDITADDWSYGLKIESAIRAEMSMSVMGYKTEYALDSTTDATVSLKKDAAQVYGFAFAGKGEESVTMKMSATVGDETQSASLKVNAGMYFDNNAIYLDYSTKGMKDFTGEADISEKAKVSTNDLIEYIMNMIDSIDPEEPDYDFDDSIFEGLALAEDEEGEEGEEGGDIIGIGGEFSISGYLDMLAEMGAKIYVDSSDGLKLKVSAGEAIKAEIDSTEVSFEECVVDLYLVFDANGAFKQFSIDMDLDMTIPFVGSVTVKGGVKISAYTGTVTLPAGIENDTSYEEIDLSEIPSIGGLF